MMTCNPFLRGEITKMDSVFSLSDASLFSKDSIWSLCDYVVYSLAHIYKSPYGEVLSFLAVIVALLGAIFGIKKVFIKKDFTYNHKRNRDHFDKDARKRLIAVIKKDWIEGVLKKAFEMGKIGLTLVETKGAVAIPKLVLLQQDREPRPIPSGKKIIDVFDEVGGSLLILGDPGSGKTMLMLELADELLRRAENDENKPVPLVFKLSSWSKTRLPLDEWLEDEIIDPKYEYPINRRETAKALLEGHQIIPLLDGLDEVESSHLADCARKINAYFDLPYPLVVSCRKDEYEELKSKYKTPIELPSAVLIQPLTIDQIRDHLSAIGTPMDGVRTALQGDPELWDLLKTPLMLNIMKRTFWNIPATSIGFQGTLDERRRQLFGQYVEAMFRHHRSKQSDIDHQGTIRERIWNKLEPYIFKPYSQEKTIHWLAWLANAMKLHNEDPFYLEHIQPDWLSSLIQKKIIKISLILAIILLCGLVFGLVFGLVGGLFFGLEHGLVVGLLFGLAGGLLFGWDEQTDILPEKLRFNPNVFLSTLREDRFHILVFGLVVGLVVGLVFGLVFGLVVGLVVGLVFGLVVGLARGFVRGLEVIQLDPKTKSIPNEGIYASAKNAIYMFLAFWLLFGLAGGLLFWLLSGQAVGLFLGLVFGLFLGLAGGLDYGGRICLMHIILRVVLRYNNHIPLRYVDFLDYAVDLIFLRKVGGGYQFIHGMVKDYFASLEAPANISQ